ncbi:hypothetical protein GJAV_G00131600 [Gymnothorax javanicus]|nr:hypothetical protein GJAV_G00131600 [Gymnothorax javanicus]
MIKVSEGKYRVGESSTLIFVRILRNHVMVRVGGGWDTLEHYLDKHDPCRCTSIVHKQSKLASPQRAPTPVHELKTHLTPQKDGHMGAPATLLLGRTQSPLPPVHWTPTAPPWGQKSGIPSPRSTSSPNPGSRNTREQRLPSPSRQRERSVTPSRRQTPSEAKGDSVHFASTRTGRDIKRTSPSPRLSSSLPRPIQPSPVSQPETARPKTPLVIQGAPNQMYHHPQPALDPRLAPSWTKSQFSSKLRQSITPGSRSLEVKNKGLNTQGQGGLGSAKALVPERCRSPIKNIHHSQKEATTTNQLAEDCRSPPEGAELICSFSPVKLARDEIWGEPAIRPLIPIRKIQRGHIAVEQLAQKKPTPDSIQGSPLNKDSEQMGKVGAENTRKDASRFQTSKRKPIQKGLVSFDVIEAEKLMQNPKEFQELMSKDGGKERGCLFTPPPITVAQEASLYQSLEQEILSNLQLLSMESNENNFEGNQEPGSLETPENKQEDPSSLLPMLCEQSLSCLQYGAQDSAKQVGCDEPTNEPLAGRKAAIKVDVESWVATLPRSSRNTQPQPSSSEVDLGQPLVPKPCPMCSWSSVGSSLESKEALTDLKRPQHSCHDGTLGTQKPNGMMDPAATSTTSSLGSTTENPLKPKAPSFKQNRTLKKPERVPSIYKLKLRPRVRPRRDHRPEKKPSRIPTPLSYRGQPTSDLQRAKGCTSGDSRGDKQSSLYSPLKTSKVGIQGSKGDICISQHGYRQRLKFPGRKTPVPEMLFDQEQESWV